MMPRLTHDGLIALYAVTPPLFWPWLALFKSEPPCQSAEIIDARARFARKRIRAVPKGGDGAA